MIFQFRFLWYQPFKVSGQGAIPRPVQEMALSGVHSVAISQSLGFCRMIQMILRRTSCCATLTALHFILCTVASAEEPIDVYENTFENKCYSESCFTPATTCTCCGDYLFGQNTLTGDWNGKRSDLADSGITFDGDVTLIYQGVADGGVNQTFNYAGHGDYLLGFDFGKMGIRDGLSLQLRAENRWGEFLAADAGLIAPAALHAATPTIATENLILTNVLFTQVVMIIGPSSSASSTRSTVTAIPLRPVVEKLSS